MRTMLTSIVAKAAASTASTSRYVTRLAQTGLELRKAQSLRFQVFNVELGEGLAESVALELDADRFDSACDHLLVIDTTSDAVVGTYRLQTGERAQRHFGYYCEREFDLTPFAAHRAQVLELGRACVHAEHRSFAVLNALWRAIAVYARANGSRYLIGCSSLTSQDETVGAAAYHALKKHLAPAPLCTLPQPNFACDLSTISAKPPKIPKLLAAYLALGIKLCGPPAIDREFKTIDFLTLFDLEQIRLDGTSGWMRFED
jgi:putative hemolysin